MKYSNISSLLEREFKKKIYNRALTLAETIKILIMLIKAMIQKAQ